MLKLVYLTQAFGRFLHYSLHLWTWRKHLIEYQEKLLDGH